MKYSLLFFSIAGCLIANGQHTTLTDTAWKTYKHKNGYSIDLPPVLKEGKLDSLEQFYDYKESNAKASYFFVINTKMEGSPNSLAEDYNMALSDGPANYSKLNPNNYTAIFRGAGEVQYRRAFIKNDRTYRLLFNFPISKRNIIEKWMPRVIASFK